MRQNEKITALYERLSRDDFGKDDDQQRESNSISNQKSNCWRSSPHGRALQTCVHFHGRWNKRDLLSIDPAFLHMMQASRSRKCGLSVH